MSALTAFGATVVTAMLVFYALEDRAPVFVLLFAGTCLASSAYGFLQGAWPIGVVEAIWTGVAVQRWRARTMRTDRVRGAARPTQPAVPVACDMSAFSPDERRRYHALRPTVMNALEDVIETPNGFRGRVGPGVLAGEIAEWMALERRCCPFLELGLRLTADGGRWLELQGGTGVKELVQAGFAGLRAHGKQ
jgi:hypothetical protein